MDEIDRSVFKIPGLGDVKAADFAAETAVSRAVADVSEAVAIAPEKIVPKEIVVPKEDNFYEELTAISEEILECRSKILEIC